MHTWLVSLLRPLNEASFVSTLVSVQPPILFHLATILDLAVVWALVSTTDSTRSLTLTIFFLHPSLSEIGNPGWTTQTVLYSPRILMSMLVLKLISERPSFPSFVWNFSATMLSKHFFTCLWFGLPVWLLLHLQSCLGRFHDLGSWPMTY